MLLNNLSLNKAVTCSLIETLSVILPVGDNVPGTEAEVYRELLPRCTDTGETAAGEGQVYRTTKGESVWGL